MHDTGISNTSAYQETGHLPGPIFGKPKKHGKKLTSILLCEITISLFIYYYYPSLENLHGLVAPCLLGASTAALAQSINQYSKKKFNQNKIYKFILWGLINGICTVLWTRVITDYFQELTHRVLIDQLIGSPVFQLVFNILNSLWNEGTINKSTRITFLKAMKYSYFFWPFFSIVLFVFIPAEMLFPATCLANLMWNIILSKLS